MEVPERWTFENQEVAEAFDMHVREQLPWYDLVTDAVVHIARHYIPAKGIVYDIGASTGNIARALADVLKERSAVIVPIEKSAEMVSKYSGPGWNNMIEDDALDHTYRKHDLSILFLTFMFLPVHLRRSFLDEVRSKLNPGGAIIIVDKTIASSGYAATVVWRMTLAGKVAAHCDAGQIVAKELSLGGVQRPIDPATELPSDALNWFRFGDFAGWIIEA